MARSVAILKAYKGPMVILALSATLIVALALPRGASEKPTPQASTIEVDSQWNASVKRAVAKVGDEVEAGQELLILVDSKLEAEILDLESQLKQAMVGTKVAVAEPGIIGGIGTVAKVVWETPAVSGPIAASPPPEVVRKSADPQIKVVESEMDKIVAAEKIIDSKILAKDEELKVATKAANGAEAEVITAQAAVDASNIEQERLQKLFDMGAIPKNQLDQAVAGGDAASEVLSGAKKRFADANSKQEAIQRDIIELRAKLSVLRDDMESLRAKLAEIKDKSDTVSTTIPKRQPARMTAPIPVRKVVYGSAAESMAPLQVKLVDDVDPKEATRIEALRKKILELRQKREALKIRAPRSGRITFIAAPGLEVGMYDRLIQIQF
jgi:hypothetical protein